MRKFAFYIFCLLISATSLLPEANAQSRKVTGFVLDASGMPVPGVTVMVSGTSKGTTTNADGKYSMLAGKDDILLFSCLGYKEVQERVENRTQINIVMQEDAQQLEETVVIAYGTAKKSDLTGSVSVVSMDDIENTPATSLDAALQGRVAGMEIISGGGEPGEDASILIRGARSLSAGNEPLIVVDGVVDAVSSFSELEVQDIKSVSVLKDASSTAMYGSRGANGVILVTTKGGVGDGGKLTIVGSASVRISTLPKKLDIMNAAEFAQFRNDLRFMQGYQDKPTAAITTTPLIRGAGYPIENPASYGTGTDWMDVLSRTGVDQSYYVAAKWGEQRSSSYISVSYNDLQGIIIGTGFRRIGTLVKFDRYLFKWLRLNFKANYTNTDKNSNKATLSGTSTSAAIALSPLIKPTDTWNRYSDTGGNGGSVFNSPYLLATQVENKTVKNYLNLSGSLDFIINKSLSFKSSFTDVLTHTEGYYYSPSTLAVATLRKTGGTARRSTSIRNNILWENTLNYNKSFAGSHKLKVLAGFTMQNINTEYKSLQGTGYLDDNVKYWNMGGIVDKRNLNETTTWAEAKRMSFLARVDYSWRSRYFVTLNGRYDGSSMFSEGKKWGFFPSAAFKWSVSNEQFMAPAKGSWLTDLSIRLSAGRSGNDSVSSYVAQDALTNSQYGWLFGDLQEPAYYPTRLENANLAWETTNTFNLGVDMSVLNNRFIFQAEIYKAYTNGLLLSAKNAAQSGFTSRYVNVGSTENQGVEFSVKSHNLTKSHFDWSTTFSISHNKQMVTDVGIDNEYIATATSGTQMIYGHKKGYPANSLWGYQFAGVWHNEAEMEENKYTKQYISYKNVLGYAKYIDVNHDGISDQNDWVYLGSPEPVVSGGLLNDFKIWGVDFSFYFTYSLGGKIYNLAEYNLGSSSANTNHYRYMMDCWHPVRNPDSDIPSARSTDSRFSSRFVHDASFLRLQNVSISYTLDLKKWTRVLRSVTFAASGENLWLISSYNGFDPDVTSSKVIRRYDGATYPKPRKFQFSIKITY
ncbi:MAG: TonB-dependent receptor [Bacteroidales bacterium]|nr:TonB-dependent receptor [Bacteroidales bacterium]